MAISNKRHRNAVQLYTDRREMAELCRDGKAGGPFSAHVYHKVAEKADMYLGMLEAGLSLPEWA